MKQAVTDEIESLLMNKIWNLVPAPTNQRIVVCKWIYKIKEGLTSFEPVRLAYSLEEMSFKTTMPSKGINATGIEINDKLKTRKLELISKVESQDIENLSDKSSMKAVIEPARPLEPEREVLSQSSKDSNNEQVT